MRHKSTTDTTKCPATVEIIGMPPPLPVKCNRKDGYHRSIDFMHIAPPPRKFPDQVLKPAFTNVSADFRKRKISVFLQSGSDAYVKPPNMVLYLQRIKTIGF